MTLAPPRAPGSVGEHHVSHDRVFRTHEGWRCIVRGQEFGPWPTREEAAVHLTAEQPRAAARKESHDRMPLERRWGVGVTTPAESTQAVHEALPPQRAFADLPLGRAVDPERHPTIDSVNALLAARLSTTEKACRRIAVWTGAPAALLAAIVLQLVWIGVGLATHWDPYPFVFLLTCSNVLQLVLIFVIAVAQRQSSLHDELRAEADHGAISRLLYHQQAQELLLVRLAEKLDVDTRDLTATLAKLARNEGRPAGQRDAER